MCIFSTLIHLQKIELLVLFVGRVWISGNDPFATVGEGGGIRMRKRRRGEAGGRKGWRVEWRERDKEGGMREKLEEISLALWRGQRGEGPLIGGHYLNHVKRQNCIYLFKWIFGGRRAALTGSLQPPAKLIYRRMPGNALFNLPAAGQVLSRPCATTNARYVRWRAGKKRILRVLCLGGKFETRVGLWNSHIIILGVIFDYFDSEVSMTREKKFIAIWFIKKEDSFLK